MYRHPEGSAAAYDTTSQPPAAAAAAAVTAAAADVRARHSNAAAAGAAAMMMISFVRCSFRGDERIHLGHVHHYPTACTQQQIPIYIYL